METTDKTLLEMQQQMQQLRDKLENQTIVSERILRNSYGKSARYLRFKSRIPIIAGLASIALIPVIATLGLSTPFLVFTGVLMAGCVIATIFINSLIPDMDRDLVSAAQNVVRYRKINKNWIKFGLPMLVVWLGLFIWDLWKNTDVLDSDLALPMGIGMTVGVIVGLLLGLKNRRDILNTSDELLDQIEQLKK